MLKFVCLYIATMFSIFSPCEGDEVFACNRFPKLESFQLRHIEGMGIGYDSGYTSLDLLVSLPNLSFELFPFIDLRGHVFNDGQFAANTGIGVRWFSEDHERLWGVNFFYDYRKTSQQVYNQVALGFESLGNRWDFRINAYLPVGKKRPKFYDFHYAQWGTNEYFLIGRYQFAMHGFNAEAGVYVGEHKGHDLYLAAGPYYFKGRSSSNEIFKSSHCEAIGGRIRAVSRLSPCFIIEASASYDNHFKWIAQAELTLRIPFGAPLNDLCGASYFDQLFQRIQRSEIIVVDHILKHSTDPRITESDFDL